MINKLKESFKNYIIMCKSTNASYMFYYTIGVILRPIVKPILRATAFKTELTDEDMKEFVKCTIIKLIPLAKSFLKINKIPSIYDDISYEDYHGMFVSGKEIDNVLSVVNSNPNNILVNDTIITDGYNHVLLVFSRNLYNSSLNNKILFKINIANILVHELTHYKQFLTNHEYNNSAEYIRPEMDLKGYLEQPIEKEAMSTAIKFLCRNIFKVVR